MGMCLNQVWRVQMGSVPFSQCFAPCAQNSREPPFAGLLLLMLLLILSSLVIMPPSALERLSTLRLCAKRTEGNTFEWRGLSCSFGFSEKKTMDPYWPFD